MVNRNVAVIFAGGVGSRMGHPSGPKQFIEVAGKPIIVHTIERFQRHEDIDSIYISCIEDSIDYMQQLVYIHKLDKVKSIVAGGESAQESIYNGLSVAVDDSGNNQDTCVLIHDGVRPIINSRLIDDNIKSVKDYGSAISSIPAFETVSISTDGGKTVDRVEDRNLMYILQAPQSFRLFDIYNINKRAAEDGMMGRFIDQAHMMNHYGNKLNMIEGFRGNVKITVPIDLAYFKFLVDSGEFSNITGESL